MVIDTYTHTETSEQEGGMLHEEMNELQSKTMEKEAIIWDKRVHSGKE